MSRPLVLGLTHLPAASWQLPGTLGPCQLCVVLGGPDWEPFPPWGTSGALSPSQHRRPHAFHFLCSQDILVPQEAVRLPAGGPTTQVCEDCRPPPAGGDLTRRTRGRLLPPSSSGSNWGCQLPPPRDGLPAGCRGRHTALNRSAELAGGAVWDGSLSPTMLRCLAHQAPCQSAPFLRGPQHSFSRQQSASHPFPSRPAFLQPLPRAPNWSPSCGPNSVLLTGKHRFPPHLC